jgi:hypothetical protein
MNFWENYFSYFRSWFSLNASHAYYVKKHLFVQGDQKVSVHLMITAQKTRKNILNSFNHIWNVDRAILNNVDRAILNNADRAILNNADHAILNNVDCAILNNADRAILNNADRAILNNADRAILNNVHRAILNSVDHAILNNVDCAILNTVFENTVRCVSKCLETGGGLFEHCL